MTIYKIKFKRTKESEWESGIRIECPQQTDDLVLDNKGSSIHSYFDYKANYYDFCIDLTSILKD